MNLATMHEDFGEQMAALTAGTRYAIDSDSNNASSNEEAQIREVMYTLWKDASSKKLADYLRRNAESYFRELYEFSYGVVSYDEDPWLAKGTEKIALMIIAEKEKQKMQIKRLEDGYKRFYAIMDEIPTKDAHTLIAYFCEQQAVDYETLRMAISRNLKAIEYHYERDTYEAIQRSRKISDTIEGPAPKMKPPSQEVLKKRKERARKSLNNLFT